MTDKSMPEDRHIKAAIQAADIPITAAYAKRHRDEQLHRSIMSHAETLGKLEQAEQEHETFCKSWGMQKRMGVLEKELVRAEAHRNSLMDKIQSQLTEIGALKAQLSQAREEGARMALEAAYQACLDCPSDMLNNRGAGAIAIRAIDPISLRGA